MKKSSISKNEYELIQKINSSGFELFSVKDAVRILGWKRTKVYKKINSLKNKGFIMALNGKYALSSIFKEHDPMAIASHLKWPSYLSFWTALNFYKFTEQLPRTIFVATTRAGKDADINGTLVRFIKLAESRFFGYCKVGNVVIADREKAIIDSLLLSRYAGGTREVSKCLRNGWAELNRKKLIEYAMRMGNKSLLKRLGYLIESNELEIEKKLIEKLHWDIGIGYSRLDPQLPGEGQYDERWGLRVN